MLEKIGKYLPAISLLALASLSFFNIGYFWRIGLHFLGVTDLSNIVYSFGLAASVLVTLFFFVPRFVKHLTEPITQEMIKRAARSRNIALSVGAALGFFGLFGSPKYLPNHAAQDGLMLLCLLIGLYGMYQWFSLRFRVLGTEAFSDLGFLGVMTIGAFFQTGLFVAALQGMGRDTYNVTTKTGVLESVHIMRASTSGFVLLVDDKGMFVPQSEVMSVKANRSPNDRY